MAEVGPEFFEREPVECARDLVGSMVRWNGCVCRIVETEAYAAAGDPACHTFFRNSAREFVAAHSAGTAYVYLNYGMHWLFNILVKHPTDARTAGFVLLRALEPVTGIEEMASRRPGVPTAALCAGPGRLTKALGIDGRVHGQSFLEAASTGIYRASPGKVVAGPRIGISKAKELNWRFGDGNSSSLSAKFI
jgi:DNA-3-methyladenine glycosylase